jgi:hypothetical protein
MSAILHIVRADVRRWGPLLALFAALTIGQRLLEEHGPVLALRDAAQAGLVEGTSLTFLLVRVLLTIVLVAAVMHDTPIVGRRTFLLTRPITPRQVLLAKLVSLGVAFIVFPTLVDFMALAWRGLPIDLVAPHVLDDLWGFRLVVLLVLLLAAAMTASLVSYFTTLVAAAFVCVVILMAMLAFAFGNYQPGPPTAASEPVSLDTFEATRAWLTALVTLGAPLILLAWRRRAMAVIALGVLLVLAPMPWWPPLPRLFAAPTITPPAWASDGRAPRLAMDPPEALIGSPSPGGSAIPPETPARRPRILHATLFLADVSPGWFAEVAQLDSRFTLRDRQVIDKRSNTNTILPRTGKAVVTSRFDGWREILGPGVRTPGARLGAAPAPQHTILGALDDEDQVARFVTGPPRYDAEAVLDLWRYDVMGVVPQAPTRVARGPVFVEIVDVRRDDPRVLTVLVRRTFLSSWLRPAIRPEIFVVLKAPDRAETHDGGVGQTSADGTLEQALSRIRIPFLLSGGIQPRHAEWLVFRFSRDNVEEAAPGWIDRAQIAIVESRFDGRIRRRLHLDALTVRDHGIAAPAPPPPGPPRSD